MLNSFAGTPVWRCAGYGKICSQPVAENADHARVVLTEHEVIDVCQKMQVGWLSGPF